ncbi:DinB family protein [Chloroflexi bacterium TSY]|nr:DinB family protein [Chloroflexi bacterium TSY]
MLTPEERRLHIEKIRRLPSQLRTLVANLSAEQLTTHYLEGEWSVAQNVHHLADAHMNSFILFKRILSEERWPLRGYDADCWADMADANHADIELSLSILENLHRRWVQLLTSLSDDEYARVGVNSQGNERSIDEYVRIYSNHGEAHLDQIQRTLAAQSD